MVTSVILPSKPVLVRCFCSTVVQGSHRKYSSHSYCYYAVHSVSATLLLYCTARYCLYWVLIAASCLSVYSSLLLHSALTRSIVALHDLVLNNIKYKVRALAAALALHLQCGANTALIV
jgi:hypothetical protein